MTISAYPLTSKLVVNYEPIGQVIEIKYLGVLITRCGRADSGAQEQQVMKTNEIADCLTYDLV